MKKPSNQSEKLSALDQENIKMAASPVSFEQILEDQTEFIVRWLPDGTRVYVNESYCRYYGIDKRDAIGTSFFPLIPAEFLQRVKERIAVLTPEAPVSTGEHQVLLPDGSLGWNQWTDRAFFDAEGSIVCYQSVGRDITDRKKAESQLEIRFKFESLILSLSNMFINLPVERLEYGINQTLSEIGAFMGADRTYLCQFEDEFEFVKLTHEWCAPDVTSVLNLYERVATKPIYWFISKIIALEAVSTPDVEALPPESGPLKELLQFNNVKSCVDVPLISAGKAIGFVGFECHQKTHNWSEDSIVLLRIVGEMLVNALNRRVSEARLLESKKLLANAQKIASVGSFELKTKTERVVCSEELYRICGIEGNETLLKLEDFLGYIHPHDTENLRDKIIHTPAPIGSFQAEARLVRGDGAVRSLHIRGERIASASAPSAKMVIVCQDITERHQAEQSLIQSEERYRLLYHGTPVMLHSTDAEGRILSVSNYWLKKLGYSRNEVRGKKTTSFLTPESRKHAEEVCLPRYRETGVLNAEPMQFVKKNGDVIDVLLTAKAEYQKDGKFSQSLGFVLDITEQKRAETALHQALAEVEHLKNRLQEENIYLQSEIKQNHQFTNIIGQSKALRQVLTQVEHVAKTDANVLVLGETGTGKELVARGIHELSNRSERPLVRVNCAALPANLIESELFGHEKGAFTGATSTKIGRFQLADKGTLFLDEIGDLPLELQVKLLRVLQEGEFERLGSHQTNRVDVRIIAATNRDLDRQVSEGSFREDLFYRLNVFPVNLPPLRDRTDDIPLLAHHYIGVFNARLGKNVSSISAATMRAMRAYHWPGNVRELENIIERAMVTSFGDRLELGDWLGSTKSSSRQSRLKNLQEVDRDHILKVLMKTTWRVSGAGGAAEILGLKPTTLEARMKKLGIRRPK